MINQDVITNFRSFANNNAHAVVDEQTPADSRARMDFDAG